MSTDTATESIAVVGRFKYAEILQISVLSRYWESNSRYKAAWQSQLGLPKPVYLIFLILTLLQLSGPALCLDSSDIWEENLVFTDFLRMIGVLWQAWRGSGRLYAALVISIISIVTDAVTIHLVYRFGILHVVGRVEGFINLLLGKYLRPILGAISVSGIPTAIHNLIEGEQTALSLVVLVVQVVSLIWFFLELHLTSARVLIEPHLLHEWHGRHLVIQTAVIFVLVILSTSLSFTTQIGTILLLIIQAAVYGVFGGYAFVCSPTIKRRGSVLLAAFSFSGALVSIVGVLAQVAGSITGVVFLVIFIIGVAAILLGLTLIEKKLVRPALALWEACDQSPEQMEDLVLARCSSPGKFIRMVHLAFEAWPPFLFTWKACAWSLQQWAEEDDLCLMWGRMVSLFPKEDALFRWLTTQYSKATTGSLRTAFLQEMVQLSGCRVTETTPRIRHELSRITRDIGQIRARQRRFWKSILQNSVESFWQDTDSIFEATDLVAFEFNHLLELAPNNLELLDAYANFLIQCRADVIGYQAIYPKLLRLESGGVIREDVAVHAAKNFLPHVNALAESTTFVPCGTARRRPMLIDQTQQQIRLALQNVIQASKMGSITLAGILITLGSVATIIVTWVFVDYYTGSYCQDRLARNHFVRSTMEIGMKFGMASLYACLAAWPLMDYSEDQLYIRSWTPILWARLNHSQDELNRRLPRFKINPEALREAVATMREDFETLADSLKQVNDPAMYAVVGASVEGQGTMEALALSILMAMDQKAQELVHGTDQRKNIEDAFAYYTSEAYITMTAGIVPAMLTVQAWSHAIEDRVEELRAGSISMLNTLFLVIGLTATLLIGIPMIIAVFSLTSKAEIVTTTFTSLPNTAVRDIVSDKVKDLQAADATTESHEAAQGTVLATQPSLTLENFVTTGLYFGAVLISCIGACVIYFTFVLNLSEALRALDCIGVIHGPIFMQYFVVFYCADAVIKSAFEDQRGLYPYFQPQSELEAFLGRVYRVFIRDIATDYGIIVQGLGPYIPGYIDRLWDEAATFGLFYENEPEFDRFQDIVDYENGDPADMVYLQVLERLLVARIPTSLDQIYVMINEALDEVFYAPYGVGPDNGTTPKVGYKGLHDKPNALALMYYFADYAPIARWDGLFSSVTKTVDDLVHSNIALANSMLVVVIIIQLAFLLAILLYLYSKGRRLKRVLTLLAFFDPNVVLESPAAISVLTTGNVTRAANSESLENAHRILRSVDKGVILCTPDLIVMDVNDQLAKLVLGERTRLRGKEFADLFQSEAVDGLQGFDGLLSQTHDALRGKGPTVFAHRFSLSVGGDEKLIEGHVLCLTNRGVAMEMETSGITEVAFLMQDLTKDKTRTDALKAEQLASERMLHKVIPEEVVKQLEDGAESVSFAVQSSSIGYILVTPTSPWFATKEFDDQMRFYHDVYESFDQFMEEYKLLTKVRTVGNVYIYAGGVFGSVNKPEKHAEEATRFALHLIQEIETIAAKAGDPMELTVGLNTGGPLVAGVVGLDRPSFQLIGPPFEIAEQLMLFGIPMQLHITRSVYELIYAHNFHVTERGEIKVQFDRTLPTYVIEL